MITSKINWRKRILVCINQVTANRIFGSAPIGGVRTWDKDGNVEYLNQHPKTDWDKELAIARTKHLVKSQR